VDIATLYTKSVVLKVFYSPLQNQTLSIPAQHKSQKMIIENFSHYLDMVSRVF